VDECVFLVFFEAMKHEGRRYNMFFQVYVDFFGGAPWHAVNASSRTPGNAPTTGRIGIDRIGRDTMGGKLLS